MYVIMFGNDDNLYHEGPFKTWKDAKKRLEQRYEEDKEGVEEEWADLCYLGKCDYMVYYNGEYVVNAEIYSIEDLFGTSESPSWDDKETADTADAPAPSVTARYYMDGECVKEAPLVLMPRRGENVMLDHGVHEVQQVCYYAADPHIVEFFLYSVHKEGQGQQCPCFSYILPSSIFFCNCKEKRRNRR